MYIHIIIIGDFPTANDSNDKNDKKYKYIYLYLLPICFIRCRKLIKSGRFRVHIKLYSFK